MNLDLFLYMSSLTGSKDDDESPKSKSNLDGEGFEGNGNEENNLGAMI